MLLIQTKAAARGDGQVSTVTHDFANRYFRLYAPTERYFDKSWPLPDIEKVK